jgi:hypothetical protein
MKTIIISDIRNKEESIFPYALNFTKHLQPKATVLHVVDPRKQHAVSSAYADSQTFEVGEKLSHEETIEREIQQARQELEEQLSYEASRLNFPLRTNVVVKKNTLEKQLQEEGGRNGKTLIIVSSKPDGGIIESFDEFMESTLRLKLLTLVVPPGMEFNMPSRAFALFDFEKSRESSLMSVVRLLKPFNLKVNVGDMDRDGKYIELEIKSTAWEKVVNKYFHPKGGISTNILSGKDQTASVIDFIRRNNYPLVLLPVGESRGKYSNALIRRLIDELDLPILLYQ